MSWNTPSPWAPYVATNAVGQVPPPFIPVFNLQQERKERRLFLLQRSVFNLVDTYNQIALTDPRLLQWYLCLSPDDKNMINEEGGFYHFLQRHPGLEVSQGHAFEKYVSERRAPSAVASRQQLYVSQARAAESQTYTCDQWAYMGHGNKRTAHGKAHLSCEGPSDLMEEDMSILVCLPSEEVNVHKDEVSSCPGTSITSPPAAGQQVTFTMPRPTTYDAAVSTEPTACSSVHTQTEAPETAEKHTSVQFYAGDADCPAEDFMKLKMSQEHEEPEKGKRPLDRPANTVSVLQKLEFDYDEMKRQILMGVPLEQLKPLSVSSEKITAGAHYIPAQVIGDLMGNISSWTFQDPQKHEEAEEKSCADDKSRISCQVVSHEHFHQNEMQKKQIATCGGVSGTEMWYDAEEELQLSQAADVRRDTDCGDESSSDGVINSEPAGTVAQSEAVHLFEKSQPPEVTPSASNHALRVPTAAVNYLQSDEVAATELTGRQMHGRTVHEEFLSSRFKHSPVATAPQPPSTDLKLVAPPPLSYRIRPKTVVCITPTANQTFVPQHFGTLGSINTLTDELAQRHPDVSRQRIVDALMELRAQHRGVLVSLPLETIRDMTSELLTRLPVTTEP